VEALEGTFTALSTQLQATPTATPERAVQDAVVALWLGSLERGDRPLLAEMLAELADWCGREAGQLWRRHDHLQRAAMSREAIPVWARAGAFRVAEGELRSWAERCRVASCEFSQVGVLGPERIYLELKNEGNRLHLLVSTSPQTSIIRNNRGFILDVLM
jgi:hypothetical protein